MIHNLKVFGEHFLKKRVINMITKTNPIFKIRLERELNNSDGLFLSNIYRMFDSLSRDEVDAIIDDFKKRDIVEIKQYKNDKINKIKFNIFRKLLYKEVD